MRLFFVFAGISHATTVSIQSHPAEIFNLAGQKDGLTISITQR